MILFSSLDDSWMELAQCRGQATETFFPSGRHEKGLPFPACIGCPVMEECAEYGIATGSVGIWGGHAWYNQSGDPTAALIARRRSGSYAISPVATRRMHGTTEGIRGRPPTKERRE